ncbi:hypothetical protein [Chondromyces crocatus]|uniref:PBS lyase n=1 Tax=Chondromyces crocatus TaxID=52 RepID=A0A0K1EQ32_CHOCO|nr:hypothetical protein [Chondromyces crocatus]AKT42723.1 uncharacterized protein CMC5_069500 [Chondromyces crocatus]
MKYVNPEPVERERAEELLQHGSVEQIEETLVAITLSGEDWRWVQEKCFQCSRHPEWAVRAMSAVCFGHLARIHRTLDLARVLPRLEELSKDPRTADYVENALSDIEIFMGKRKRNQ